MSHCITEEEIIQIAQCDPAEAWPVGDLRENAAHDSSYQVLRNARSQARNNERSAQNQGISNPIDFDDWAPILDKVPTVLLEESRDLEIVAWYIEALTRRYGFLGLARGFSLARALIEAFGEGLYPRPDEEGLITQLSPLAGLNGFGSEGALIYPIKAIIITDGDSPGPFAVWQCEQILEIDRITDVEKREARFKSIGINKAQLDTILAETSTEFLVEKHAEIRLAISEYENYEKVLDEYSKDDPLPTGQILEALNNCQKILEYIAGDRLVLETEEEIEDESTEDGSVEAENKTVPRKSDGPVADRADALKRLKEVAAFFRRTEPHSPISYSIEQAVRWSGMPLSDLIKELIPDDGARKKYQNLSGIGSKNADNE